MLEFVPGPYEQLADTSTGKAVWQFLNSAEIFDSMVSATINRRPAVEGVQTQLLNTFGKEIKTDEWKLMISRMIRQIMQHHGYVREPRPMSLSERGLFRQGARYRLNGKFEATRINESSTEQ